MTRKSAAVVPIRPDIDDSTFVATLTLGQLRAALREDREAQLVDVATDVPSDDKPRRKSHPENLLDREELANRLGVSTRSVDTLRKEPGFPETAVLDAPRFVWADVLVWLKGRGRVST